MHAHCTLGDDDPCTSTASYLPYTHAEGGKMIDCVVIVVIGINIPTIKSLP